MVAADYVFWPAIAWIVAANLYCIPRIKSGLIAMQWGLSGQPTWYASKTGALWGIAAFALALRALIWAAITYVPESVHSPEIGLLLLSIILVATHLFMLRAATRAS